MGWSSSSGPPSSLCSADAGVRARLQALPNSQTKLCRKDPGPSASTTAPQAEKQVGSLQLHPPLQGQGMLAVVLYAGGAAGRRMCFDCLAVLRLCSRPRACRRRRRRCCRPGWGSGCRSGSRSPSAVLRSWRCSSNALHQHCSTNTEPSLPARSASRGLL